MFHQPDEYGTKPFFQVGLGAGLQPRHTWRLQKCLRLHRHSPKKGYLRWQAINLTPPCPTKQLVFVVCPTNRTSMVQGLFLGGSSGSKNASGPIGIPLKRGCLRCQAINLAPPCSTKQSTQESNCLDFYIFPQNKPFQLTKVTALYKKKILLITRRL